MKLLSHLLKTITFDTPHDVDTRLAITRLPTPSRLDLNGSPRDPTVLNPWTPDRTPPTTFHLCVYFIVFCHPAIHKNNVRTTCMWLFQLPRRGDVLNIYMNCIYCELYMYTCVIDRIDRHFCCYNSEKSIAS